MTLNPNIRRPGSNTASVLGLKLEEELPPGGRRDPFLI